MPLSVEVEPVTVTQVGCQDGGQAQERAVERAIEKYGAPVYVRHEIVHNRYVVESLKAKGAVFVEELEVDVDLPSIEC